jgi:hypothetical protein
MLALMAYQYLCHLVRCLFVCKGGHARRKEHAIRAWSKHRIVCAHTFPLEFCHHIVKERYPVSSGTCRLKSIEGRDDIEGEGHVIKCFCPGPSPVSLPHQSPPKSQTTIGGVD